MSKRLGGIMCCKYKNFSWHKWVPLCCLKKNQNAPRPSEHPPKFSFSGKALRTAVGEFFAHDSRSFTASNNNGGNQKTYFCSGKEGGCEALQDYLYYYYSTTINNCTAADCLWCMYGHTYSKSMDQPGKVASPARGQLNRKNEYFSVRVCA